MAPFRHGIIGCGFIATTAHLPALTNVPDAQVVGIADANPTNLARARTLLDLPATACHAGYQELFARDDIDSVTVAVPDRLHAGVVTAALQAGKHVLCEKPLATSLSEADAMIQAATANQRTLAVCHNFLFYPETRLARQVIESGLIGQVRSSWIHAFGLGMDVESFARFSATGRDPYKDAPSPAGSVNPQSEARPWLYDLALSGGGVLLAYGIHAVYLLTTYFGAPPLRVDAVVDRVTERQIPIEDYAVCRLDFPTGTALLQLALYPTDLTSTRALQTGDTRIIGDRGLIEFVYRGRAEAPHSPVEKLCVRTREGEQVHLLPYTETKTKLIDSFTATYHEFFDSLATDREPLTAAATHGRPALEIVMAAYQSAGEGRAVSLPLAPSSPVYQQGVLGLPSLDGAPWARERWESKGLYRP